MTFIEMLCLSSVILQLKVNVHMVHWWLLELHCSCFSSMIFNFNQCLWFLKCFTCSLGITTYELYAFTILSKPDFYSYQLLLPNHMQPFYFFTFFGIQACIPFWPSTLILYLRLLAVKTSHSPLLLPAHFKHRTPEQPATITPCLTIFLVLLCTEMDCWLSE